MMVGFMVHDTNPLFLGLAEIMVRSVHAAMPSVGIAQFTDRSTPSIPQVDYVVRQDREPLALFRLKHQAQCRGDWLFVDCDVIVQKDVRHVFQHSFDIALATRRYVCFTGERALNGMPYNIGVTFSRTPALWQDAYHWLTVHPEYNQEWMGDQYAVCAVLQKYHTYELPPSYNYDPEEGEDVTDRHIVHYKGPRKSVMLDRAFDYA